MKLDKKMCNVIAELEYLIGSNCYNPNSYDGWNDIEGCGFRYPINIPISEDEYYKIRSKIKDWVSEDLIDSDLVNYMKYKFGSNELFIGMGLIEVLEYLEKRYNIDFNEMERNRKSE